MLVCSDIHNDAAVWLKQKCTSHCSGGWISETRVLKDALAGLSSVVRKEAARALLVSWGLLFLFFLRQDLST